MDTNQQNNVHVNSFTKGMNTDTSLDMVNAEQYVFGQNIRITNNALLNALIDANSTEGIVTPVQFGKNILIKQEIKNYTESVCGIMATAFIENFGAIITKIEDKDEFYWSLHKAEFKDDVLHLTHLFTSTQPTDKDKLSVVINKELENVVKLYIADGKHPIINVDLNKDILYYEHLRDESDIYDIEDKLCSNRIFPTNKVKIVKKISGLLNTSQIQYTYRFYNKYGTSSRLAPLTNKIQVIDNSRIHEIGNAEDTQTSVGFRLKIDIPNHIKNIYDYIQIYRLSYIKAKEDAKVELICDKKTNNVDELFFNDNGVKAVEQLSIEEFQSLNGSTIIPEVIEQNQNYLFAGNVKDTTKYTFKDEDGDMLAYQFNKSGVQSPEINKYVDINLKERDDNECKFDRNVQFYGGTGKTISWRFITTKIPIHSDYKHNKYPIVTQSSDNQTQYFDYVVNPDVQVNTQSNSTVYDYFDNIGVYQDDLSYDNVITSSVLRSLHRDEVYRYGIVLYDKYGNRSDAQWIADIRTPTIAECPITSVIRNTLYANTLGIEFDVDLSDYTDIVGYEIVRCETENQYQQNIAQCCISNPVMQTLTTAYKTDGITYYNTTQDSPFYPTPLLTTKNPFIVGYGGGGGPVQFQGIRMNNVGWSPATTKKGVHQLMNIDMQFFRNDLLSYMSETGIYLNPVSYVFGNNISTDSLEFIYNSNLNPHTLDAPYEYEDYTGKIGLSDETSDNKFTDWLGQLNPIEFYKNKQLLAINCQNWNYLSKPEDNHIFYDYNTFLPINNKIQNFSMRNIELKNISDTKNIGWDEGFTNIQEDATSILSVSRAYKGYIDNVADIQYNNWISSGMYDLRGSSKEPQSSLNHYGSNKYKELYSVYNHGGLEHSTVATYFGPRMVWLGSGPQCFIAKTEDDVDNHIFNESIENYIGTALCNIKHTAIQYAGTTKEDKQYDIYYGFGNYHNANENISQVFDGNIYITPCEIVTMFKTYDFNSLYDTLYSSQVIYYVPMESKINTFFDYGMNYRNTSSANLMLEPGEIKGIYSQDRPLHQYNMIYSDNSKSNNVFNAQSLEDQEEHFPQRIVYSELKTNGEFIDSWNIFKAINFIDTDTRYGDLTNLLTARDVLYYWQTSAFGRLTVNERSLVTDDNSNKIQLGQGGVLQRADYIDTKHGMREGDFASTYNEGGVFWIDITNKTIMNYSEGYPYNIAEMLNVQNILNSRIEQSVEDRPVIDYDMQNNELLCKCLTNGDQLVFNLKAKIATSLYNRRYQHIANINNTLVGLFGYEDLDATKYNYLSESDNDKFLYPTIVKFSVNSVPSTTKVFDNQKIVILKHHNDDSHTFEYFKNIKYKFTTDLYDTDSRNISQELISDREGNICYAIPRVNDPVNNISYFGQRLRGKWMTVEIKNNNPEYDFAISHIITKFRQSFS